MADQPPGTPLARYRGWFYGAALYNLLWGGAGLLFPGFFFDLIGRLPPRYLPLWQDVGMFVLVYAPDYGWVAHHPECHPHLVHNGLLGKVLGSIGFLWSASTGQLPWSFGGTILTIDPVWWPAFLCYVRDIVRLRRGWNGLLYGE